MASKGESSEGGSAMGRDPLGEDDDVLSRTIFGGDRHSSSSSKARRGSGRRSRRSKQSHSKSTSKPSHYKVISISMYNEDIERLDEKVAELKKMGHTKANRSALIRFALDQVDIEEVPRSY